MSLDRALDAEGRPPFRRSIHIVPSAEDGHLMHRHSIGYLAARALWATCAGSGPFGTTAKATARPVASRRVLVAALPSDGSWPLGWRVSAIKGSHDMSLWLGPGIPYIWTRNFH